MLCDEPGGERWVNGYQLDDNQNPLDSSFHPNDLGYEAEAGNLYNLLKDEVDKLFP